MNVLKTAVTGMGFIGRQHAEAVRRVPNVKITAVSDPDPSVGNWCEENGIPNYYADYREMLAKEDIDVVHNCSPNHLHFEINKAAIEHGCHIYSEKPLTLRSSEAEELTEMAAKRKGGLRRGGLAGQAIYRQNTCRTGFCMRQILTGGSEKK